MAKRPCGSRVFVQDIVTTLSIEERAKRAGFVAIVDEDNRPKATEGRVVAVGDDPFIQERITIGDVVTFGRLAGRYLYISGEQFRELEYSELTSIEPAAEYEARLKTEA